MDVTPEIPPVKVAFVIDNQVIEVLHTDDRLAAIFLSNPVVLDVTGPDGKSSVDLGDIYDPATGLFSKPE